jgi:uncharacterized protein YukE
MNNMTKIDIDTTKLKGYAEDLDTSADEYIKNIDDLYNEIIDMKDKIWTGAAAEAYVKNCEKQKGTYLKHANAMKSLSTALLDYINTLELGSSNNGLK